MKKFDQYIKTQLKKEKLEIPDSARAKIDAALANLPEPEIAVSSHKTFFSCHKFAVAAACFIFVFLFFLPNVSVTYAKALEQLPIIGELVKVITIRNYVYFDETHELKVKVPKIEDHQNEGIDYINASAEELTETLVNNFYQDLRSFGEDSHNAVYIDYEVITNTKKWFTLKLCIHEEAGSSNTYYTYYNLDKIAGKIMELSDIVAEDAFYKTVESIIKEQMSQRMEEDPESVYWVEKSAFGEDFVSIDSKHNYYWNENGDLVIPFDKYEVAPGSMGTPEFTIKFESIKGLLTINEKII